MPTFTDDPVWVIRDSGGVFSTRRPVEEASKWITYADGIENWRVDAGLYGALAPSIQSTGEVERVHFEFDAAIALADIPVAVMLCTPGSHISITAQGGGLVIRNESINPDYIIAIIDHDGIAFPQRAARRVDRYYGMGMTSSIGSKGGYLVPSGGAR